MEINRRQFMAMSGAMVRGSILAGLGANALLGEIAGPSDLTGTAWHQRVRRVGQLNFNERDPVELDVEAWANYWADLKVDAVLVSVTGIIAFYPTQVPFHRRSRFLGSRDLFGECAAAARKRGIRVIARMSPDLNWDDAVHAHPEWFARDLKGGFVAHGEGTQLYHTCMFSTYFTDYVPALIREIKTHYEVDGFYTNGWPPLDALPVCYCDECRKLPGPNTVEYWDLFTERVAFLWKSYDTLAKDKAPDSLFFANLGSGMRATPNLKRISGICEWFNCDNQGRGGDAVPIWGAAQQGRVATAIMKGRTVTNVTGAYSTGAPVRWRNAAKSRPEAEIWMDQTAASGMTLWYHWLGGQKGLGEDRRWQQTGRTHMHWLARNDIHFERRRTVANIAVVMGQRSHLFYTPPGEGGMPQFMDGLYSALVEGRFMFDYVHEQDLGPENIGRYSAILLPGVAWLSDGQCRQLVDYVAAGGSLMATFETAMYDETGKRRSNCGLADLFGIESVGPVAGPLGNGFYARIERPHEILAGFEDTNWIPGGAYRLPVKAKGPMVLSVVPAYTAYPPELSYAPVDRTDEPAVIVRENGSSRLLYYSADLERTAWRSGHTDLSRLIQNSVAWLTRNVKPVSVVGDGILDCIAWETAPGYAVHMLNYTNPNMHRGWLRRHYRVGEQKVRMVLPAGRTVARVRLLRAEQSIPFSQDGSSVEFTVPGLADYEVAAVIL
jgi:hypothetical protein